MYPIKIKFGNVVTSEIEVMLNASADSGVSMAKSILNKQRNNLFELNKEEAEYLSENLIEDSGRVGEACGSSAGRAFENAGLKLKKMIV